MDDDAALRGGDVAALQRRLHSEINPDFFSSNFRPMMQLVSILSAEARGRAGAPEPAEEGGDGAGDLKVFTLEGSVVRLRGLGAASTVDELRSAVRRRLGADFEDQRLYVDADPAARSGALGAGVTVARLDLLNDGAAALGDRGVFRDGARVGEVHLRNRAYETLRKQLQVATDAVESLLAAHYDAFNGSVAAVERTAAEYDALRRLTDDARARRRLPRQARPAARGAGRGPRRRWFRARTRGRRPRPRALGGAGRGRGGAPPPRAPP